LGRSKERFAQLIFGILIVEDILAILMIAMLSGFATTGSLSPADVGQTIGKLGAFLGVLLVAGLILVPRLLNWVAKFKSNEMLLVTVTGLCFGVSLLAVRLGYSVALGAFLIGAIIAEARHIYRIEALMHPVRDLFSAVFFVSIGLLIDPAMLMQHIGPILIITALVVVGKVLTCSFGTFVAGNDIRSSMQAGMGLAQIGEFSFIIASLGLTLKVTSEFLYPIAVAVSALTTLFTPYLIKSSDAVVKGLGAVLPPGLLEGLDNYTRWIGGMASGAGKPTAGSFLRKWGWQIALNLLLIAAVFIGAAYARDPVMAWWPRAPAGQDGIKGMLWLGAMILSLPMVIAVVRKLRAFGMLVSEMSVTRAAAGENTANIRAVVSGVVFVAGCAAMLLYLLLLSSAILPSWNLLIVLALVLAVTAFLLRRAFMKLHARAQFALQSTLSDPPLPPPGQDKMPALLRDATLVMHPIAHGSPAAGKVIAEVQLRSRTGASIVAIERGNDNIINPSIDEEIRPGDSVLLLGTEPQIEAARKALG
ncbi:MAG TPA: cation:proton antiporter, partial [Prosthecobacter sp.]|nr:cation:proton antiporter [Prosthecobacter sp.]